MKSYTVFLFTVIMLALSLGLSAQTAKEPLIIDDIQVDVKEVLVDSTTDTATVSLFLISYSRDPREFKLNTYATQLIDAAGEGHLYTEMTLGRIRVSLADEQNYMHFLFHEELPASFTIKVANWDNSKGMPKAVNLVFEDSEELGKFITFPVALTENHEVY